MHEFAQWVAGDWYAGRNQIKCSGARYLMCFIYLIKHSRYDHFQMPKSSHSDAIRLFVWFLLYRTTIFGLSFIVEQKCVLAILVEMCWKMFERQPIALAVSYHY